MIYFIIRRLLQSIPVLIAAVLIAFVLSAYVGDPVSNMLGQNYTDADAARIRSDLGLDQPVPVQFAKFVWRMLHGDFGVSYRHGEPVSQLMLKRVPASVELGMLAILFAFAIGVPIGVYSALYPHSWLTQATLISSLVGISIPTFLLSILLIILFSVILGWLPAFDRGETVMFGWWSTGLLTASGRKSLILPMISIGLFQLTLITRMVRAEMQEVLRTDYIKFARARGLTNRAVHFRHALKNTLVPVVTFAGLQLGAVLGFAVVTESVFQWPGLGLLFIQAVAYADLPVMATFLCFMALIFVVINLLVDIAYVVIDPRLLADHSLASGSVR